MSKMENKNINFYKLGYQFTTPGLYCVDSDTKGFNEYRFYDGVLIEDWPEDIIFIFDGAPDEDFLQGGLHWRLVSEKVRRVFLDNDIQGVQFLPIVVTHNQISKQLGSYWILNVIQSVDKVDWKLVENFDIFRRSGGIFISERLKNKLEQAVATSGASFSLLSERTLGKYLLLDK